MGQRVPTGSSPDLEHQLGLWLRGEPPVSSLWLWDCGARVLGVSGPSKHTEGLWMRQGAGRAHRPEGLLASTLCRLALQRPSAWELEQKQGGLGPQSDQSLHLSCSWNLLWKTQKQWQILVWKFILFWPLPNIGKIILFLQVHQSRKGSPLSLGPV